MDPKVFNFVERDGLVLGWALVWGLVAVRVGPERTDLDLKTAVIFGHGPANHDRRISEDMHTHVGIWQQAHV